MQAYVDYLRSILFRWATLATGGVIMAGIWLFDAVFNGPVPHWLNPAAAVLFLLVAPFLAWRDERTRAAIAEERLQPRLAVSCSAGPPCVSYNKRNGIDMKWLRVQVTTKGQAPASKCRGYIKRIEKEGHMLWGNSSIQLPFTPSEKDDAFSKTIRDKHEEFLDVLVIIQGGGVEFATRGFEWPFPQQAKDIFAGRGDYIITVVIGAEECPSIESKLKFVWTQDYATAELLLP